MTLNQIHPVKITVQGCPGWVSLGQEGLFIRLVEIGGVVHGVASGNRALPNRPRQAPSRNKLRTLTAPENHSTARAAVK
jgi:hypothetical protein